MVGNIRGWGRENLVCQNSVMCQIKKLKYNHSLLLHCVSACLRIISKIKHLMLLLSSHSHCGTFIVISQAFAEVIC